MNLEDLEDLEDLVDKEGLGAVLLALNEICFTKAEHLRTNWQDDLAAKRWEKAAALLERLGEHQGVKGVL